MEAPKRQDISKIEQLARLFSNESLTPEALQAQLDVWKANGVTVSKEEFDAAKEWAQRLQEETSTQ